MYGSEIFVFIVSSLISVVFLFYWYLSLETIWPRDRGAKSRFYLHLLPPVCAVIICVFLLTLASFDVVDDPIYIFFYIVLGMAWLAICLMFMFMLLDISWRDDAIENNNKAAVFAVSGGMLGITAIYAGANIGDGPGWWTVVVAGGFGVFTWFLLIIILQKICSVCERITIERDLGTGIRMFFYMIASGLILGRGAAGDWTSFSSTVIEFIDAWPVLGLALLAGIIEWQNGRKTKNMSLPSHEISLSAVIGILYLLIAILVVLLLPELPQNILYGFAKLI
jgi:hypothetical protein